MISTYCLPIMTSKMSDVLLTVEHYNNEYQFFEIWLEYLEDRNEEMLKILLQQYEGRIILVFRRKNLEPMQLTLKERQRFIDVAVSRRTLIDLDVTTQQEELEQSTGKNMVIASYHNYDATPDDDELRRIIASMQVYRPTIYKIATTCRHPSDALRLLALQLALKAEGKRVIILGMGEHGHATRIFGTLWGNEMIFAPQQHRGQSAPGQLTKGQLETIFKELLHAGK